MAVNAIKKIDVINKDALSNEFYFNSLIDEGLRTGVIDDVKAKKIQMDCLSLLSKKCNAYSGGASASIRTELAENILKSLVFVIGACLKGFDTPEIALENLCEQGIETIYAQGKRRIGTKQKMTKQLHRMVMGNMMAVKNYAYIQTLTVEMNSFFKRYNSEYCAHEINITVDYETANPIKDFAGIEYIREYLQAMFYENMFCSLFSLETIEKLLAAYSLKYSGNADYSALIVNIYSVVLKNAIGCVLLRKMPFALSISEQEMIFLTNKLSPLSKEELLKTIEVACQTLFLEIEITSEPLQKYMLKTLPNVVSDIYLATENKSALFIEFS